MPEIKQGDVWLVDFNPAKGDEIKKIRPAVVISADFFTGLKLKIVIPVTEYKKDYDKIWWLFKLKANRETGLDKTSVVNCYQMRTVSEERFLRKLGTTGKDIEEIAAIAQNCITA